MSDSPPPQPSWRLDELIIAGVWFGLVTGIVEIALLGIKKFYLGQLIKVGGDAVWMAPLVDVCFFLAVAIVLALVGLGVPAARRFHVSFTMLAALSVFAVVLHYSQLVLVTKALIASGFGMQAARLAAPRAARFSALVNRTLPWAATLVVVLGVGLHGWRRYEYQQAVAALPAGSERANVLLIVLDTVRARNLSLYGYGRDTSPNLDRLARNAATFERAIAPSPWTFPSHASMFTGRWPHELSADWGTPLDATYPTLAEVLRDHGYLTAGFAANTFYCTREFGIGRGFLHYEDYPISPSQAVVSSSIGRELIAYSLNRDGAFRVREWLGYQEIPGRRRASEINRAFLNWLSERETKRPFFAFLNYLDAHQPFLPPSPFDTKFLDASPRGDPRHWWERQWSPHEIRTEADSYDGAIAYIDEQVGALTAELQRRGMLDNTVVIVTSDHGEHLGEHGFMRHGNTLYMEALHVPLLIVFPERIKAAVTVRQPVSLRDLPATVLALLGLECEGCFPGRSLAHYWESRTDPASPSSPTFAEVSKGVRIPDRYPNARGDLKSLIADGMHYIANSDGSAELFDLNEDPREERNLAKSPGAEAVRERLKTELESFGQPRRSRSTTADSSAEKPPNRRRP